MTSKVRLQKNLSWLCAAALLLCMAAAPKMVWAEAANRIQSVTVQGAGGHSELRIRGGSAPTYTVYELFDPLRVILDIADAELASSAEMPANLPQGPITRVKSTRLAGQKPVITRLEIFLADDRGYTVERQANDVVVSFSEESEPETMTASAPPVASAPPEKSTGASALLADLMKTEQGERDATVTRMQSIEMIQPVIPSSTAAIAEEKAKVTAPKKAVKPTQKEAPPQTATTGASLSGKPTDSLTFAGYENRRITIDFYKIDLHNVFRLFGEISGRNIVVDEDVKGSLTLALSDVPWDFALDIVLNLKDLEKEERFNTIVIAPKKKGFSWPKEATDSIAFKSVDGSGQPVEAISIKERLDTPREIIEAKKIIMQAQQKDKAGNYREALALYEESAQLWPANDQIASRIATIALVHLGMNAKAAHYAEAAVKANRDNHEAALQAAIAHANMKKIDDAKRYFDIAISGKAPSPEALFSYASFCEEYKSYGAALALLKKYDEVHGASIDTMIASARIYDKMGDSRSAVSQYEAILLSGFEVPADLRRYIEGRIAAAR